MEDLYDLSNVVKTVIDGSHLSESSLNDFIPAEGPLKLSPDKFVSLITDIKSIRDANVNVYKRFVEDGELFTISLTNSVDLIEEFMRYFDVSAVVNDKFQLYKENPSSIMASEDYQVLNVSCPWGDFTNTNSTDYGYNVCYNCIKYNDEYGIQKLLRFYPRTIELLVRLRKLHYLQKYATYITDKTSIYIGIAAENGDIECIKWLISKGMLVGKYVYCCAAHYGQLECIKWLHAANYPWSKHTLSQAALNGDLDCFKYIFENMPEDISNIGVCENAAAKGHIECLKWAIENGIGCSVAASARAAENGHLECLKYLHASGIEIHRDITAYGACTNIECLRWAYENGYRMSQFACSQAERHGNIDCLRYAHENGGIWHDPYLSSSLHYGNLEIIKYVYEKGICTKKVYVDIAAQHLHVLKWLHESNLINFDKVLTSDKLNFDGLKTECAEYLLQHKLTGYIKCFEKDKFKLFATFATTTS